MGPSTLRVMSYHRLLSLLTCLAMEKRAVGRETPLERVSTNGLSHSVADENSTVSAFSCCYSSHDKPAFEYTRSRADRVGILVYNHNRGRLLRTTACLSIRDSSNVKPIKVYPFITAFTQNDDSASFYII